MFHKNHLKNRMLRAVLALLVFQCALAFAQITVPPYLQNPAPGAVSIFWQTAEPAYGWIEYGATEKLGKKQDWSEDGLRNANTNLHHVRLTGLPDGADCFYRAAYTPIKTFAAYKVVFGETQYSPVYHFRLPAAAQPRLTACFINDVHNRYEAFRTILPELGRMAPDCVFFNGDMFSDPANTDKVSEALRIYGEGSGASARPVFFVRGNHETRGAYARQLKQNFDSPTGKYYFGVTLGPVRFTVLDLGEDKPDIHKEYSGLIDFDDYRKEGAAWLKTELASPEFKRARWHVLVQHIPLYGNARAGALHGIWLETLKGAPIDAAISGHTHRPLIHKTGEAGNPYPVVIGGGRDNTTLIVLQADAQKCTIDLFDRAGKKMDSVELRAADKNFRE